MSLSKITLVVSSLALGLLITSSPPESQDLAGYLSQHGYNSIAMSKLSTGHETVEVEINGVSGRFVLDLGAGATVVHSARLSKYGLVPTQDLPEFVGIGAGGQSLITSYPLQSLTIDGVALDLDQVRGMNLSGVVEALSGATGAEIDGVVGQDVLTRYQGVIDVNAQQLFLRPQPR